MTRTERTLGPDRRDADGNDRSRFSPEGIHRLTKTRFGPAGRDWASIDPALWSLVNPR